MLRQVRRLLAYVLAVTLMVMGMAQAVVSARVVSSLFQDEALAVAEHAHHGHDHKVADQKSKRDCFGYCVDIVSEGYLIGDAPSLPDRQFIVSYPLSSLAFDAAETKISSERQANLARGPPEDCVIRSSSCFRSLLLLNARVRN